MAQFEFGPGTFSIVARDGASGRFGLAAATRVPAVGALCLWARPGTAAVATQAWTNPYLAERLFAAIEAGAAAPEALERVMGREVDAELRQVGVVDARGRAAAYTGEGTDGWAGHVVEDGFAAQGNMLAGAGVVSAMAAVFRDTQGLPLAERLLKALEAGEDAGGDRRGKQSAALRVQGPELYAEVDLRVDEHPEPISELARIYGLCRRELFPFVEALPTRTNPRGAFERVRAAMKPKD